MSVQHQENLAWSGAEPGLRTADSLYLFCAILLVVIVSAVHLFAPLNIVSYERDVWHHMAVINELLKSPFHAGNPHVDTMDPSRGYMPWFVGLAIIGKALGFNALQILGLSAMLSVAALVAGVYLFARAYFRHPWAPLLLLGVLFSTWLCHFNHVGFHTLSTLLFGASYPFFIVFALGFFAWWCVLRALAAPRLSAWQIALLLLMPALMLTLHQLQGPFAIGGMMCFAVFHPGAGSWRRGTIVALVLVGILLSALWPYFNPLEYASTRDIYKFVYRPNFNWKDPVLLTALVGLSILGIGGFRDAAKGRMRWDLIVASTGILAGIVWSLMTGNWIGERFIPFLIVFLQIGLVGFFLQLVERGSLGPSTVKKIGALLVTLACLNIFYAGYFAIQTMRYQHGQGPAISGDWARDTMAVMQRVRDIVGAGKVVIAEGNAAYPVQANDMKVVAIPRLFAEVPDMVQRQADTARFFEAASSNAERCDIIQRYHVSNILFRPERVAATARQQLEAFGAVEAISNIILVTVRDDLASFCAAARQAS